MTTMTAVNKHKLGLKRKSRIDYPTRTAVNAMESRAVRRQMFGNSYGKGSYSTNEMMYRMDKNSSQYYCTECSYSTKIKAYIQQHMVRHTDVRPFRCPYNHCNQAFKRSQSLKRHINGSHLNLRPHRCTICMKRFRQSSTLKDHMYQHLSGKTFTCDVSGCKKVFQTPKNMNAHKRRRHGKVDTDSDNKSVPMVAFNSQKFGEGLSNSSSSSSRSDVSSSDSLDAWKPFNCHFPKCGHSFEERFQLLDHLNVHNISAEKKTSKSVPNFGAKKSSHHKDFVDFEDMFLCNFSGCDYHTKDFEDIANHFIFHWQILFSSLNS